MRFFQVIIRIDIILQYQNKHIKYLCLKIILINEDYETIADKGVDHNWNIYNIEMKKI